VEQGRFRDNTVLRQPFRAAPELVIEEPIAYGGWSRRRLSGGKGYQDFAYATKPR
jgi:hypothetical protein